MSQPTPAAVPPLDAEPAVAPTRTPTHAPLLEIASTDAPLTPWGREVLSMLGSQTAG